ELRLQQECRCRLRGARCGCGEQQRAGRAERGRVALTRSHSVALRRTKQQGFEIVDVVPVEEPQRFVHGWLLGAFRARILRTASWNSSRERRSLDAAVPRGICKSAAISDRVSSSSSKSTKTVRRSRAMASSAASNKARARRWSASCSG